MTHGAWKGPFSFDASPERTLVFGVNDFDETLPGPYERDVKRLLASVMLAAGASVLANLDRDPLADYGPRGPDHRPYGQRTAPAPGGMGSRPC